MARTVKDARLETRTARGRLKARHDPYWRGIEGGRHVGYRKGKKRSSWIARLLSDDGKYKKKVLGLADDIEDADGDKILDWSQAQTAAREWFKSASTNGVSAPDPGYTVREAVNDYIDWYKGENKKSLRDVQGRIENFILPALGSAEVRHLTPVQIRNWHRKMALEPPRKRTRKGEKQQYRDYSGDDEAKRKRQATANKVLTILKAALNKAWHDGEVASDEAWRRVKPFKNVDAPRVLHLSGDECRRIINASDPDFRNLVRAALLTGCRYGELTAMQVQDFNPDTGHIYVRPGKTGKPRDVPLTEEGQGFLESLTVGRLPSARVFLREDGETWGYSHQIRRLAAAVENARIDKPVTFHILRHTYGSMLAMRGVPMAVIATVLGHADTRTTEKHYAHLLPSYVADTIRANLPMIGGHEDANVEAVRPGS